MAFRRRRTPGPDGDAPSPPPDAYLTALVMLSRREWSTAQLRDRLRHRGCPEEQIDDALARLREQRSLDDARVARAAAHLETSIRRRGPARVRQRLRSMGLADDLIDGAISEAFREVDVNARLDEALTRRLRGQAPATLDDRTRHRLIRALVQQGFPLDGVLKRLGR
ncbi:MAG: recombination regulator RecX [Acidobacteria bacterium]|nr:recombination regulator RecX [Acidobacteriota bacterium]